jgi:excinuclease UvrABC nuclease subunit
MAVPDIPVVAEEEAQYMTQEKVANLIKDLTKRMEEASKRLEFEEAALLRDRIQAISLQFS